MPSRLAVASLTLALFCACDEPRAPAPPDEEPAAPEEPLELPTDGWQIWARAFGVQRCRHDATRVRELLEANDPAAVRGLAELDACTARYGPSMEVATDRVHAVEVETEPAEGLGLDEAAAEECVRTSIAEGHARLAGMLELRRSEGRYLLRVDTTGAGEPLAGCLARALPPPSGDDPVRISYRAGPAYSRPCLDEPQRPRVRVEITSAGELEDALAPDLEVLLFYRGLRLTATRAGDPSWRARARLRCPIAVSAERPLGVLVLERRGQGASATDVVRGWGELASGSAGAQVVDTGEVLVRLRSVPEQLGDATDERGEPGDEE